MPITPGMPRVGVVVVTWNRVEDAVGCLESLPQLEYANHEVFVIDNASVDATVATIRERFPQLTLIANTENVGWAAGANRGMQAALAAGAEYVFLLNSDTKITPAVLRDLVRVMEDDPRIAIAGAKNLLMGKPGYTWGKYGVVTWGPTLVRIVGRFEPDHPEPPLQDVQCVIGNGCLIRRNALERVGLFDESFFQVDEDADWCLRARAAGYRVVYVDTAVIYHRGGSSSALGRAFSFSQGYFAGRNAILFARRHATAWQWVRLLLALATAVLLRSAYYASRAFAEAVIGDLRFVAGMIDGARGRTRFGLAIGHVDGRPIGGGVKNRVLRWLGA
jgi:GT2 family glycosyltransferase